MSSKLFPTYLNFLVLILLCCPSFSIIYALTGLYVANEKIAFLLCVFYLLKQKKILLPRPIRVFFLISFIVSLGLFTLLLLRYYVYGISISITNFNYILSFYEVIVFISFFYTEGFYNFLKSLKLVIAIQCFCAFSQVILVLTNNYSLIRIFTNHYTKNEYIPPLSVINIPRPFGLFHEASELSAFLSISLLLFIILYTNRNQ